MDEKIIELQSVSVSCSRVASWVGKALQLSTHMALSSVVFLYSATRMKPCGARNQVALANTAVAPWLGEQIRSLPHAVPFGLRSAVALEMN